MSKTMRVAKDSLRVTNDDSNEVYTGLGFGIFVAGTLMRTAMPPPSVLF